jgi:uncharacterized circularly permuted ATP-grasp superfamily protein/uncharacterized alpha-E superfamily protein
MTADVDVSFEPKESPNKVNPTLPGYQAQADRYDEMFLSPGAPRPHWQPLFNTINNISSRQLGTRIAAAERQIRDSGITYNVYTDPEGLDRQWELDVLPLVISAEEWHGLEQGISQRARLFNRILADLYGPQTLIRDGLLPASLILGHSGFLRNAHGMKLPGRIFLHLCAADLTRSADGQWWVIADRTQAPSGAGYALENRLIVSQVFPELFRSQGVQHLAHYFAAMRDSLMYHAPKGDGQTLAVVLTPGPYNETYFEHALLARYLGFRLVDGSDLVVGDNKVWLKTIDGPRRVHVIIRRQDDVFCDPLELRVDSILGVAGLMECVRRGSVLIANPPGAGILEAGALMGFLPSLCEHLLDEKLILPSIATWWCGEPAALSDALNNYKKLVFKPADPGFPFEPVFGQDLDDIQLAELRTRIDKNPERFIAQELVHVSQAPVLSGKNKQKLAPRAIGLRVHASASPGGHYIVMPGGLTRVATESDSRIVSMQRGGGSKDTWVLADGPQDTQFTLLRSTLKAADLVSSSSAISSRVAENEFWLGRTSERCECVARLLRSGLNAVLQENEDGIDKPIFALLSAYGMADDERSVDERLRAMVTLEQEPFGLAANLRSLNHIAFNLRDRLSLDHWRTVTQLLRDPAFNRKVDLSKALNLLDNTIVSMTTLAGFALDSMTRDAGFQFLSIGRRLERLAFITRVIGIACHEGRDSGLTWLLELCDSVITYRSRYMSQPEWLPVLDLLLRDKTNPRALMFQVKGIYDYLSRIEERHGPGLRELLLPGISLLDSLDIDTEFNPDSERLQETMFVLNSACFTLSDRLTGQFFNNPGALGEWSATWR